MNNLILEDGSSQRKHGKHLRGLLASTKGTLLRIASAYVTDDELLAGTSDRERRLLISLSLMDVASGATSIETLGALIESGVNVRWLPASPRLHAKVYIFGTSSAIVTSANLTDSAFKRNIEAGVEVNAGQAGQLAEWFDSLWKKATRLTPAYLSELQSNAVPLRNEFAELKKKAKAKWQDFESHRPPDSLSGTLADLFDSAKHYFVCNTNRPTYKRSGPDGCMYEKAMFANGFAAAWESFRYPKHMERVEAGDVIFMFANGRIGIVGVGIAKGGCKKLLKDDLDRIRPWDDENRIEWRVPVQWWRWTNEDHDACPFPPRQMSFWEITNEKDKDLVGRVRTHFLAMPENGRTIR